MLAQKRFNKKSRLHTGTRIWHPTTSDNGITSAQFHPGICHSNGTASVVNITIIAIHAKQMQNDSLKRCQIRGTSIQNDDCSTSLPVEPHVMSYENRWARRAVDRWMLIPPKKNRLRKIGSAM